MFRARGHFAGALAQLLAWWALRGGWLAALASRGWLVRAPSSTVNPRLSDRISTEEIAMSVGKVSEITSTSKVSFEDAIQKGLKRANKTLRNIKSAWIKEQTVRLDKGKITEYQVNMLVTFVLEG